MNFELFGETDPKMGLEQRKNRTRFSNLTEYRAVLFVE